MTILERSQKQLKDFADSIGGSIHFEYIATAWFIKFDQEINPETAENIADVLTDTYDITVEG